MKSFIYYYSIISLLCCVCSCNPYHYDFYSLDNYPPSNWTKINVRNTASTQDSSDFNFKRLPILLNDSDDLFQLGSEFVFDELLFMRTLESLLDNLPPIVNEQINHKKIKKQVTKSLNDNEDLEFDSWFYYNQSNLGLQLRVEPIYLYDTERLLGNEHIVDTKRIRFSLPFISFNRNEIKEYDQYEYRGELAFKISIGVRYDEKEMPPIYSITPVCGKLTYRLMNERWW